MRQGKSCDKDIGAITTYLNQRVQIDSWSECGGITAWLALEIGVAVGLIGLLYSGYGNYYSCITFFNLNQWIYISTTLNLIFIMADQYVSIEFPIRYPLIMTDRVNRCSLVVIWLAPSVYTILVMTISMGPELCDSIPGNEDFKHTSWYFLCAVFAMPYVVIIPINIRILLIARKKAIEVGMIHVEPNMGPHTRDQSRGSNMKQALVAEKEAFKKTWKSLLTATIMITALVVCALPFCVVAMMILADRFNLTTELLHLEDNYRNPCTTNYS